MIVKMTLKMNSWTSSLALVWVISIVFYTGNVASACTTIDGPSDIVMTGTAVGFIITQNDPSTLKVNIVHGDGSTNSSKDLSSANPKVITLYHTYTPTIAKMTFTATVTTTSGNTACSLTQSFTITFKDKVNIISESYPPVAGNFEITIFSITAIFGTDANLTVEFGDGNNSVTPYPGTLRTTTYKNISHMYTALSKGLPVGIWAGNDISGNVYYDCTIKVQERIKPLSFAGNDTVYWTPGLGKWVVGIGENPRNITDIVCEWSFGCSPNVFAVVAENVSVISPQEDYNFRYHFARSDGGNQCLALNCSNDLSYQCYNMYVNVIILSVDVNFTCFGPVFWNDTSVLSLQIIHYGPGGCIELELGDGTTYFIKPINISCTGVKFLMNPNFTIEVEPIPQTLYFNYTYPHINTYWATARSFNHISNDTATIPVVVKDWYCLSANITAASGYFDPTAPIIIQWSSNDSIITNPFLDCKWLQIYYQEWALFSAQDLINNITDNPILSLSSRYEYDYYSRSLPYGVYGFRLNSTLYSTLRDISNYTTFVNIFFRVEEIIPPLNFNGSEECLWKPGLAKWAVSLPPGTEWLVNLTCVWSIGPVNNSVQESVFVPLLSMNQPHEYNHTFQNSDCGQIIPVSVNCSNPFSWRVYGMDTLIILDSVNVTDFQYSGVDYWNNSAVFSFNISRFGSGSCFELDFGNGVIYLFNGTTDGCWGWIGSGISQIFQIAPEAQIIEWNYTYPIWGSYQAKLRAFNHVNNDTLLLSVIVLEWTCETSNISLDPIYLNAGSPAWLVWSQDTSIQTNVTVDCMKNEGLTEKWDMYKLDDFLANSAAAQPVLTLANSDTFNYQSRMLPPGFYVIRINASMYNHYFNMSQYDRIVDVYVEIQEVIQDLVLSKNDSLLWSPGVGMWQVSLGPTQPWLMNITCVWNIGTIATISQQISVLNQTTPYLFSYAFARQDCGVHNVTVNCSNTRFSKQYSQMVNVILDSVNISTIVDDGPLYWNHTMTFTLDITRFGTGGCFLFDMGDGSQIFIYKGPDGCTGYIDPALQVSYRDIPNTNSSIVFTYLYPTFGNFTVTVRAFNHINNNTLSVLAQILDWPCDHPAVGMDPTFLDETHPYPASIPSGVSINTTINISCWKTEWELIEWNVYYKSDYEANGYEKAIPILEGDDVPYFIMEPYTLKPGQLIVRMNVSMHHWYFNLVNMSTVVLAYINVSASALVAGVEGGTPQDFSFNRNYTLDAFNLTYDPDVQNHDNKTGMLVRWLCKNQTETWPSTNPLIRYGYQKTGPGCFGDGIGAFTDFLPEQLTFTFNTTYLLPQSSYTLRLEVKKDVRTVTYDVDINLGLPLPPVFLLDCKRNCLQQAGDILPRVKVIYLTILKARCQDGCWSPLGDLTTRWIFYEGGPNPTDPYTVVPNLDTFALIGPDDYSLSFYPKTLKPITHYKAEFYTRAPMSSESMVEYYFVTNKPPYDGTCTVDPPAGEAAVTDYTVTCSGWQAWQGQPSELNYEFRAGYRNANNTQLFYYGKDPTKASVKLPCGNSSEGDLGSIYVLITDALKDLTVYIVDVTVHPPPTLPSSLLDRSQAIINQLPSSTNAMDLYTELLSILSVFNYPTPIDSFDWNIEVFNAILPENMRPTTVMTTAAPAVDPINERETMVLRTGFINFLLKQDLPDSITMDQRNSVFQSILLKKSVISLDALESVANYVESMIDSFNIFKKDMPIESIVNSASNILGTTVSVLEVANYMIVHGDDTAQRKATSYTAHKTLDAIDRVNTILLDPVEACDPPVILNLGKMGVALSRTYPKYIVNTSSATYLGNLEIEGVDNVQSLGDQCLEERVVMTRSNPYLWDASARNVTSPVVSATINNCGSATRVRRQTSTTLGGEFQVRVTTANNVGQHISFNTTDAFGMIYHFYNLTSPGVIPLLFRVTSDMPKNDTNRSLTVYIKGDHRPTPVYYDWKFTENRDNSSGNLTVNDTSNGVFTMFLTPNDTSNMTIIYIGVQSEMGCFNSSKYCTTGINTFLQYYISLQEMTCQYWSPDAQQWQPKECDPPPSIRQPVKFKSHLLGGFGAGFATPVNTIDFGALLDHLGEKILGAAAVWGTISAIIVLYIPIAILARMADKGDVVKWLLLPLADNWKEDEHEYEIHVHTGVSPQAGTKSNIYFRLFGSEAETGIRKLDDGVRKDNFVSGRVGSFIMKVPETLGVPINLQIWHDNSGGKQASWYLSKVIVADVINREWYLFSCERWLSTEKDDHRLRRSIRASHGFSEPESSSLMKKNVTTRMFDEHMWLSVAYREKKSYFTRAQRLGLCLATLFLAMIANCMFYKSASDQPSTTPPLITLGPIKITGTQLFNSFMSSLIVIPPIVLITLLFTRSKPPPRTKKEDEMIRKYGGRIIEPTANERCRFPYWCNFIAWQLVFLAVTVGAFFTILYSMQWGQHKSIDWLTAFLLSFFQSLVVIQPAKIVIVALLMSFIIKDDPDVSEYEKYYGKMSTVDQDQYNYVVMNADAMGDARALREEMLELKKKREIDNMMKEMIREILFYVIFLSLLLIVVNGQQDFYGYTQNNHILSDLMQGLDQPHNIRKGFFAWAREVLVPEVYATQYYNGEPADKKDNPYMSDLQNWRIGPPRIRQIRVSTANCKFVAPMMLRLRCTNAYKSDTEDKSNYDPSWLPAHNRSELFYDNPRLTPLQRAYIYQPDQDHGLPFTGKISDYHGGGYSANLGDDADSALQLLDELENSRWVDFYTRALLVEFNVLNAGTGLANLATVLLEMPNVGDQMWMGRVEVIQLYRYTGPNGVVALLSEILCAIFVVVLTILELYRLHRDKMEYLKNVWNSLQLLVLIMFYVAVGLYTARCLWTIRVVEDMRNNPGKLVSFLPIIKYNNIYLMFMGMICFCTQCQLLHLLRYNTNIAILGNTLLVSIGTLSSFSFMTCVIFYAFCMAISVMFFQMPEYSSFYQTAMSLMEAIIGKFNINDLLFQYGLAAGAFLLAYLIAVIILVTNMFISILNEYLADVGNADALKGRDHEVVDHFLQTCKGLIVKEQRNHHDGNQTENAKRLIERIVSLEEMADSMIKSCNAVDKSSAGALWSALLKQPIRFDNSASAAYKKSYAAALPYMGMKGESALPYTDMKGGPALSYMGKKGGPAAPYMDMEGGSAVRYSNAPLQKAKSNP